MTFTATVSLALLVSDFESSLAFYDGVMAELGCTRYDGETDTKEAKYCFDEDEDLEVLSIIETSGTTPNIPSSCCSFTAKKKSVVDTFFATAIAKGATEIEEPALREDNFYSATVQDLNGHKIKVIWPSSD